MGTVLNRLPSNLEVCLRWHQLIFTFNPVRPLTSVHPNNASRTTNRQFNWQRNWRPLVAQPHRRNLPFSRNTLVGETRVSPRACMKQLWCQLPGYVGPSVQDRPEKVTPSLTLSEIERFLVAYFLAVYHQRIHETTGEAPAVRWQKNDFDPRMPSTCASWTSCSP
jgi:hypothetical protein